MIVGNLDVFVGSIIRYQGFVEPDSDSEEEDEDSSMNESGDDDDDDDVLFSG